MFSDFKFYKSKSNKNSAVAVLLNPCYYIVVLYRLSNWLYKIKLEPFAKIVWLINRIVFSVDIDYRAKIGKNFRLIHGIGVVIGREVVIGNEVSIYQGVTIGGSGKTRTYKNKIIKQPIIKDNVTIFTNACVFGPVIIDTDIRIKAMQVVTKDLMKGESI